ncbi:hypothetical protein ACE193_12905 [Bernardetia sp. OM2101]|uniref:hypothetical protein n=1 Tax=Bernardetia sp. OM2101 TaxID=3344876 RepID=UPI0035CF4300
MKLKNSIKKTVITGFAGLGLFLVGSTSLLAQNYQSSFSSNSISTSFSQNSSLVSFSTKDTDMAISPWEKRIGITGAFGEGATSMTLGFSHLYGFGSSRRFKLGYGVRLSSFFGSDRKFTAAPPDLASEDNPQYFGVGETFFGVPSDSDNKSQLNAINLGLYTDYSITENVLVGFNIDVIGFSFGAKKEGTVYDERNASGLIGIGATSAKPTSFNALLVGDNDIGTLNSEFWIGYRIASNVMVRGAFSYLFTEYTTDGQYQDGNDRFRYKAAQGAVGVSYTF